MVASLTRTACPANSLALIEIGEAISARIGTLARVSSGAPCLAGTITFLSRSRALGAAAAVSVIPRSSNAVSVSVPPFMVILAPVMYAGRGERRFHALALVALLATSDNLLLDVQRVGDIFGISCGVMLFASYLSTGIAWKPSRMCRGTPRGTSSRAQTVCSRDFGYDEL